PDTTRHARWPTIIACTFRCRLNEYTVWANGISPYGNYGNLMLEESTGLGERRATTIVTTLLFALALFVFLFKYLPLDAGLWTLQGELIARHMAGHTGDGWKVI